MILRQLILTTVLAVCGFTTAAEPFQRNVEFARVGDRTLSLDLYAPTEPTTSQAPTIIWVHGGAWRAGSKSDVPVLHCPTPGSRASSSFTFSVA